MLLSSIAMSIQTKRLMSRTVLFQLTRVSVKRKHGSYHRQQNKWYPQRCLLAHNNIIVCYYGQVNTYGVPFILLLIVQVSKIKRITGIYNIGSR